MAEKDINLVSSRPQAPEDVPKTLLDPMANPCYYLGSLFVLFINNVPKISVTVLSADRFCHCDILIILRM